MAEKTRTVMQYPRAAMENFPNAVSRELGRNDVSLAQKDLMYRVSNTFEWYSRSTSSNGAFEGVVCYFYQVSTRIVLNNIFESKTKTN
jgi:hypothetical protein